MKQQQLEQKNDQTGKEAEDDSDPPKRPSPIYSHVKSLSTTCKLTKWFWYLKKKNEQLLAVKGFVVLLQRVSLIRPAPVESPRFGRKQGYMVERCDV